MRARRRSHYRSLRRLPCPTDESRRPLEAGQAVQNQLAELRIQERVEHRIRDAGQHGEAEKAQFLLPFSTGRIPTSPQGARVLDCDSLQAALAKMLLKGSNYSQVGDEIQEICVVVPVVGEQIATVGELHESTDDVVRK